MLSASLNKTFLSLLPRSYISLPDEGGTPHRRHFQNFFRHCTISDRIFHSVLCNVWLLTRVVVVKPSSRLVVVIANTDILATSVLHKYMCTHFSWIPRDSVLDMYRVIPFPWHFGLWWLVSCLPVLLLNFENQCQIINFLKSIYWLKKACRTQHNSINVVIRSQ